MEFRGENLKLNICKLFLMIYTFLLGTMKKLEDILVASIQKMIYYIIILETSLYIDIL